MNRFRRFIPLLVIIFLGFGMTFSIINGYAAIAALQGFVIGLCFDDAIDFLLKKHHI